MMLVVRGIYHNGQIKLLEPVDLREGQTLKVSLETLNEEEAVRAALGDLVIWSDSGDDSDAWVETEAEAVATALSSGGLTEIMHEEREGSW